MRALAGQGVESGNRLRHCGLLVAVPLTREQFFADVTDARKEFIRRWVASFGGYSVAGLWSDYQPIAAYALQIVKEARQGGVAAVTNASFGSWAEMTAARNVVTLVAHWVGGPPGAIEYADGPHVLDDVVAALPRDFDGVLDLTVCHSTCAIAAIKRARPRCSVLANRNPANLDLRLAMYRQVLRLIGREGTGYTEALRRVHLAALERL
jgi:hypothetical protein